MRLNHICACSRLPSTNDSLKRALKGLLDRGDVLVASGAGGPDAPYHYVAVETVAAATART
jgi:hypothetical protein